MLSAGLCPRRPLETEQRSRYEVRERRIGTFVLWPGCPGRLFARAAHHAVFATGVVFLLALEIWYFAARIKTISPEQARAYGVKRLEETEGPKAV